MYLSKKTYVKKWSHQKPEEVFDVTVTRGDSSYSIDSSRVSYVTEELMYWRKANQIHGWFCSNCTEIQDEVLYSVTLTNLEVLLETCKSVLQVIETSPKKIKQVVGGWKDGEQYMIDVEEYNNELIEKILPPTQGFFYGSSNIDEYYKEAIVFTIEFLEKELPNCNEDHEFEYHASW